MTTARIPRNDGRLLKDFKKLLAKDRRAVVIASAVQIHNDGTCTIETIISHALPLKLTGLATAMVKGAIDLLERLATAGGSTSALTSLRLALNSLEAEQNPSLMRFDDDRRPH